MLWRLLNGLNGLLICGFHRKILGLRDHIYYVDIYFFASFQLLCYSVSSFPPHESGLHDHFSKFSLTLSTFLSFSLLK